MNESINHGSLTDVFDALKAFEITKIDGQPTDNNINKLTTQLTAAVVTISTTNRGGTLGHIVIIVPDTRYAVLSAGPSLVRPTHPGAYPASASASDNMKTRVKEVAKHKASIKEFETYMACEAWARQAIVNVVDKEWISEKHNEDIGYEAVKPLELLELLRNAGGDLDDMEITLGWEFRQNSSEFMFLDLFLPEYLPFFFSILPSFFSLIIFSRH